MPSSSTHAGSGNFPAGGPEAAASADERVLARRARMRARERTTGLILVLALLVAAGLAGHRIWRIASGSPPPRAGTEAPVFSAERLDGGTLELDHLRGKVVLLDFWATWCPPCVASMPGLDRVHRALADRGFTVVGVNQEPDEAPKVRAFVAREGLAFPVVMDPGDISERYGVYTLPTSYLVDKRGVIRQAYRGVVSERRLEQAVEALLAEGPAASGER